MFRYTIDKLQCFINQYERIFTNYFTKDYYATCVIIYRRSALV